MSVDVRSIEGDLRQLAAGGEGIVYRIISEPRAVYKEYKQRSLADINVDALERLIEFPFRLAADDRAWLLSRTAWPRGTVTRDGRVVGIVMPAIPDHYYAQYGLKANPKQVLCDWNHLSFQSQPLAPHMMSTVPLPGIVERLELVRDLALTVDLLHRHDVIVGDMSGKNLIWSADPPHVRIIDCGSFRFERQPNVSAHKESPGWIDPHLRGAPTSRSSDVFKLAVAAYRILWERPSSVVTPESVQEPTSHELPLEFPALVAASLGSGSRPSAADWIRLIDRVLESFHPFIIDSTTGGFEDTASTRVRHDCPFCGGDAHEPGDCPFFTQGGP